MQIGTLTLTGWWPCEWDGLIMPDFHSSRRFRATTEGFERKGMLYKTLDPACLAQALGVRKAKWALSYCEPLPKMTIRGCA